MRQVEQNGAWVLLGGICFFVVVGCGWGASEEGPQSGTQVAEEQQAGEDAAVLAIKRGERRLYDAEPITEPPKSYAIVLGIEGCRANYNQVYAAAEEAEGTKETYVGVLLRRHPETKSLVGDGRAGGPGEEPALVWCYSDDGSVMCSWIVMVVEEHAESYNYVSAYNRKMLQEMLLNSDCSTLPIEIRPEE